MNDANSVYNGWTNRATWHTNLVISNTYGDYMYWSDAARMVARSPMLGPKALVNKMRREIGRQHVPDDVQDQKINWREIAESWVDEESNEIEQEA